MRKQHSVTAFLCIVICIFISNIQSASAEEIKNWYLKYGSEGQTPLTPDNDDFTEKYNVISLDRTGDKTIYLTFDAGYENGNIEKILDILDKHDITGAFFVLPNIIRSNPELIKRMYENGHLICNHTKSHKNMGKISDIQEFRSELEGNESVLRNLLGIQMEKYYRPPEGAYTELNLKQAKELGYTTVFWSLAYADWDNDKQPDKDSSLQLLLRRVHPGCVLLLHPTSSTNAAILDPFITILKEKGYSFKSIAEFPLKKSQQE